MLDELPPLAHVDAESVEDAVQWLVEYADRAKILAGGTDLLGLMKDGIDGPGLPMPEVLVNVKTIPGFAEINEGPEGDLRIGAATTLVDIERHPLVRLRFPALAQAAASVASARGAGTSVIRAFRVSSVAAGNASPFRATTGPTSRCSVEGSA